MTEVSHSNRFHWCWFQDGQMPKWCRQISTRCLSGLNLCLYYPERRTGTYFGGGNAVPAVLVVTMAVYTLCSVCNWFCENVKNTKLLRIRCVSQAQKYAKTRFQPRLRPQTPLGAYDAPRSPSRLGRGIHPPIPSSSISSPSASRSRRLDSRLLRRLDWQYRHLEDHNQTK